MPNSKICCTIFALWITAATAVLADGDMDRLQGKWRVVELTDNGRSVSGDTIATFLPSGGRMEIIDNSMLFTSPLDGKKHAKVFAVDTTAYPKTIQVQTGLTVDGVGIYRFDGNRWVMCLADPKKGQQPNDFSSPAGSNRMLMVLIRDGEEPELTPITEQMRLTAPPETTEAAKPVATATANPPANAAPTPAATPVPIIVVNPAPNPTPTPTPAPNPPAAVPPAASVPATAAALVLTDQEVATKLVGTWKLNDGMGLLFITITPQGTFQSYREVAQASTYHSVFVQSPVSSGTWSVSNGQLQARVTASVQASKVNLVLTFAIRSISNTDFLWVDYLGRVGQAVRVR